MKKEEMLNFLKTLPDGVELYFSLWTVVVGEKRYRTQLSVKDLKSVVSKNGKFARITWVDDCIADRIMEKELNE